jgi:hypothetical protein
LPPPPSPHKREKAPDVPRTSGPFAWPHRNKAEMDATAGRLAVRSKGATIRPDRLTDTMGLEDFDRANAGVPDSAARRANMRQYSRDVEATARDYSAGRDPYDPVQKPAKRTASKPKAFGRPRAAAGRR